MSAPSEQIALVLPDPRRWGGRRAGAGRKRGEHPAMRHVARQPFKRVAPAHVTVRVLPGLPSLRDVRVVRRVERSFAGGCDRPGFRLVQYSLQGNHAHLIVEASDQYALGRGMMSISARLALAVNRVARRTGRVIADRYHHRLLSTPREVHRALRYVLLNSRRHAKKVGSALARRVFLDPASSASWFDGWKRAAEAASAVRLRAPVARARTWLLTVGWRLHGLLDPADVPG